MVLRYRYGYGNVTVMGTKEGRWADIRKRLDREAVTKKVTPVPVTVTEVTKEVTDVPPTQMGDTDGAVGAEELAVRQRQNPTKPEGVQGVSELPAKRTSVPIGMAQHPCPECGAPHRVKVYKDQAAKQRAWRKRNA